MLLVELVEGKTSFQGYRGKKQDSEKKILHDVFIDGDRYMNTGDLMRVDKDYYLYFNDRVGDTFRYYVTAGRGLVFIYNESVVYNTFGDCC